MDSKNTEPVSASELLQNSAVVTFVIDAGHKVVFWNAACDALTGIAASGVIDRQTLL